MPPPLDFVWVYGNLTEPGHHSVTSLGENRKFRDVETSRNFRALIEAVL